ncbi:tryptophan halogenase family protein [Cellvibrio sp. pealriver]|uniref:tryptophan halogenase family protein n=1 Tax=Cellvibrio sp. pealriver TaxID=1622269 RepID=UPI00066FE912|nr:tryptophan halogenase family protein [Cellvibrio sp. pealriver]
MSDLVKQILIVGGGTAGWLTAAKLAKELNSKSTDAVQVTLIESPDVPTIGVGEGTWPTMRATLQKLGIDEAEFMRYCNASFKQGSKFINWRKTPSNDQSNFYYNHFTSLQNPEQFNLAPYWSLGYAGDISYADAVSFQGSVCEKGLAPKKITTAQYEGIQSYAYHLDAARFADFLKTHCTEKLGVKHLFGHIRQVNQDQDGYITSIDTEEHGVIAAEFFVDCSGFSALIIGKTLDVPFKSISDKLFVDHAIAIQVPYQDEHNDPVATQTLSTAQNYGWIWDIGLTNRRGTGYVYSSHYTDHESAEQTLRRYLGPQADHLASRRIKMNIGWRERFWKKNCVAIGMSAAFIEPLEASAIFLIEAAGNMLADQFPRTRHEMQSVAKKFNRSFLYRWDKSVEFIKMHYFLSRRDDTQFWIDNRNPETVPTALMDRLEHWKSHPPSRYDFDNVYEPFPLESYQYILYGLDFQMDINHKKSAYQMVDYAQKQFSRVKELAEIAAKELPTHRDLLNKIRTYNFQSI